MVHSIVHNPSYLLSKKSWVYQSCVKIILCSPSWSSVWPNIIKYQLLCRESSITLFIRIDCFLYIYIYLIYSYILHYYILNLPKFAIRKIFSKLPSSCSVAKSRRQTHHRAAATRAVPPTWCSCSPWRQSSPGEFPADIQLPGLVNSHFANWKILQFFYGW